MRRRISAQEKPTGIDSVHTRSRKIVLYMKDSRLRASPRHGGQGGFFFNLLVTDLRFQLKDRVQIRIALHKIVKVLFYLLTSLFSFSFCHCGKEYMCP